MKRRRRGFKDFIKHDKQTKKKKVKRRSVRIACCNGSGRIHKSVVFAVQNILNEEARNRRHHVKFSAPTWSPFVQNLHKVVNQFMVDGEDFLLLMDDDNPPMTGNPLDLVELDLDVVGLPTPVWHSAVMGDRPYYLNAAREIIEENGESGFKPLDSEEGFDCKGLQQCDVVGTGCILIARRVLCQLIINARGSNGMEAPFMRRWRDDGTVKVGNDFAFCQRARAAGFKVWAHFDYRCRHFNNLELIETIESMGSFMEKAFGAAESDDV